MMSDIQLGNIPILSNVFCNNAVYLNPFPSAIIGYLFFYKDDWEDGDDKIKYEDFGKGGSVHLYYSDYDALQSTFFNYVDDNRMTLQQRFLYGYTR